MSAAPAPHVRALDCLRGVAALLVVLQHFDIFPWAQSTFSPSPWSWLLPGRMSVIAFFVLSGFVLSLPYFRGTALPYGAYLMRRLLRLYPPYVFVILAAALSCHLLGGFPPTAYPFDAWRLPVTHGELASSLLMTGVADGETGWISPPGA